MALDLNAVGTELGPAACEYTEDDVILYALGIGVEPTELQFLYEKALVVLPTFAVVAARKSGLDLLRPLKADMTRLLHGENRIEVFRPLPPRSRFTATGRIKAIYDKGSGALAVMEMEGRDSKGELMFRNTSGAFIRGAGGFGGDRGPASTPNTPPDRDPDAVVSLATSKSQAILYRLSGDKNPLHVDPEFAARSGFDQPILHGLCTYGYAGRSVLRAFCDNDPSRLRALEVRFSGVVFPGDTLTTEMWRVADDRIVLRTKAAAERIVINHAAAEISSASPRR